MTLRERNVGNAIDRSCRRNRIQFAVIWLDRIENSIRRSHAVPGPVWLEVIRFVGFGGMILGELAEVRNLGPRSIGVDAEHTIVGALQSMGTARARR